MEYPCLYIFILEILDKTTEKKKYMKECEQYEYGLSEDYSKFVHGFWIPWIEDQIQEGNIRYRKSSYEI